MATLTPERDMLVIRLVYDGPPQSGKTTSLRVLAGSLSRDILSPEEADGRTLLFDWVEYVGGSYEGMPIRCQIVSVPGQRALARRRRALLSTADAVVFVADTTARRRGETEECLRELRAFLDARPEPRPGVVLQANKRDEPDAEPLATLRARFGPGALALVPSVATEGTGIREAFVLSVRLALDRVRELVAAGTLSAQRPDAETADELTSQVRAYEETSADVGPAFAARGAASGAADGGPPLAALMLREVLAREDDPALAPLLQPAPGTILQGAAAIAGPARRAADPRRPPLLPDAAAPSGRVWPPVEGRLVLHAATSTAAAAHLREDGSWQARVAGWHFHSLPEHEFDDLEGGREELLRWARLYAARSTALSPQRCIVLAETGGESWRLWQIVHALESLRQRLAAALAKADPEALAEVLHLCAGRLLAARDLFAGEPALPCRLSTIGALGAGPIYIGLLPARSWVAPGGELEAEDGGLIRREIGPPIRRALAAQALDVPSILDALAPLGHRRAYEALAALLIGH